jgi:glycosyltransferase involved in cell wall biosynthesis
VTPAPTVLHVTDHLALGGAELVLAGLVGELNRQHLARSIVCTATPQNADERLLQEVRSNAAAVVTLDRRHLYDVRMTGMLARMIARRRIDIVHSHPGTAHVHARAAALLCGRPHLTTLHTAPGPEIEDSRPRMLSDALSWPASALIVAPSTGIAQAYRRRTGVNPDRMRVIVNAPIARRAAPSARVTALRAELIGEGTTLVLCVARLVAAKAVDDLIRAAGALRERMPGVRVAVAGDGPCEPELRDLIEQLDLERHVSLLGRRDDIGSLLAACDAFCLPSRHEGVPVSLLEAMAAGVPCVATAVGGVPEIVRDGESGLLVKPGAPSELAGALTRLLDDGPLAQRLAATARGVVAREWSAAAQARRYAALYAELLGRASRRVASG